MELKDQILTVNTKAGNFDIRRTIADYPYSGVDIEFIEKDDTGQTQSRPRVLFEYNEVDNTLEIRTWLDKNDDDYTENHTIQLGKK